MDAFPYDAGHRTVQHKKLTTFCFNAFQRIMKRLIKRYVLKAQVDRENDEVNEGKYAMVVSLLE